MSHPTRAVLSRAIWCVIGVAVGAFAVGALHDVDERAAFDRGHAKGVQDCKDPSRLEKAAKWLAQ